MDIDTHLFAMQGARMVTSVSRKGMGQHIIRRKWHDWQTKIVRSRQVPNLDQPHHE